MMMAALLKFPFYHDVFNDDISHPYQPIFSLLIVNPSQYILQGNLGAASRINHQKILQRWNICEVQTCRSLNQSEGERGTRFRMVDAK